ncbi:hypothetical protein TWF281_006990 [Arthrobotrys megalospora]
MRPLQTPPEELPSEECITEATTNDPKLPQPSLHPHPQEPDIPNPETPITQLIPNLDILEKDLSPEFSSFLIAPVINNPERLTGRKYINQMNDTSRSLELRCRRLDLNPELAYIHDNRIHTVMNGFGYFHPYFISPFEWEITTLARGTYTLYCEIWYDASQKLQEFKRRGTIFQIAGTDTFITETTFPEYALQLEQVSELLAECGYNIDRRKKYMEAERRATVRLLVACRRFKTAQRNRPIVVERPCVCRVGKWERDAWVALGLPVVSMPAGRGFRGFAPI